MSTIEDVDVELVLDAHADLGEGPVWDADARELVWVAISDHEVHRFDPATGTDRAIQVGQHVGAAALRERGGLLLALRDGVAVLDGDTPRIVADTEGDVPSNRLNDGKCDSAGRFWFGSMAFDLSPGVAALYRMDTDGRVDKVLDGVTLSNGLGWSPDDRTFYYIDSLTYGVDAFDFDAASGTISNRRRLVDIPESTGFGDGMTVDAEGYLWVAVYAGWALHRYAPDGALDRVVRLPVAQPTCCTFGGDDLGDLYITTAAQELDSDALARQPHAGGLFRFRPGVAGLPANTFGG